MTHPVIRRCHTDHVRVALKSFFSFFILSFSFFVNIKEDFKSFQGEHLGISTGVNWVGNK